MFLGSPFHIRPNIKTKIETIVLCVCVCFFLLLTAKGPFRPPPPKGGPIAHVYCKKEIILGYLKPNKK